MVSGLNETTIESVPECVFLFIVVIFYLFISISKVWLHRKSIIYVNTCAVVAAIAISIIFRLLLHFFFSYVCVFFTFLWIQHLLLQWPLFLHFFARTHFIHILHLLQLHLIHVTFHFKCNTSTVCCLLLWPRATVSNWYMGRCVSLNSNLILNLKLFCLYFLFFTIYIFIFNWWIHQKMHFLPAQFLLLRILLF